MRGKNISLMMSFSVLLTVAVVSTSSANAATKSPAQDKRKTQLVKILGGARGDMKRVLEEFAFDVKPDSTTARLLIRSILHDKRMRHVPPSLVADAIGAAGPSVIDEILPVLLKIDETSSRADHYEGLLSGLARLGKKGRPAIASLQRMLKDPKTPDRVKTQLRIVLADLGYRPVDHMKSILADFKDLDSLFYCIMALWSGGQHSWMTDELVATLADPLKEMVATLEDPLKHGLASKFDESFVAYVAVLGSLGRLAQSASPQLEKLQRHLTEDRDRNDLGKALSATLALMRVAPTKREAAFARLVSLERRVPLDKLLNEGSGFSWDFATRLYPALLMDADLAEFLGKKLSVVELPAARLVAEVLAGSGRYARHANPRLMALLLESDDPKRRRLAAKVLGHTASFHDVGKLEKARDNEKVKNVRAEIAHAVKRIRTLKDLPRFLTPDEIRRLKDTTRRPKQKQP